jgi:PAS domain S-box-containing protein
MPSNAMREDGIRGFEEVARELAAARRQGAAFFKALIEGSRDAVVVADESGRILYQSPAVGPELGYRNGECVGHHVLEYVHPSDHALVERTLENTLAAPGSNQRMELRLRTRNEGWRWVEVGATNLCNVPAVRGIVLHTGLIHQRKLLELSNVAAKVDPHFLYNVLNSVAAMIRQEKTGEAIEAIARLRDLMGSRLHGADNDLTTLAEEWQWTGSYLALEQLRFGPEMKVEIAELPRDVAGVRVPYRIIQPLAENAVKHGLRTRSGVGVIEMAAVRTGDRVRVTVTERGGPRARGVPNDGLGVGLDTVRQRLQLHFGDAAWLDLRVRWGDSTAELHIPVASDRAIA